jgi:hypothetical protein
MSRPTIHRRPPRPRVLLDPRVAYASPAIDEVSGLPVLVPSRVVRRLLGGVSQKVIRGLRKRGELMPPWPREGDPAPRGRVYITRDSLVAYLRRRGVPC